jgi:hypothetical protein
MGPVRSRSEQVVEVECDAASKRASIVRARLSLAPSHAAVLAYALRRPDRPTDIIPNKQGSCH